MARIRAEFATRREAVAVGALAAEALPRHIEEFLALPEDTFVEAAYRVAFGRAASAEERERAGWDLRGGATRAMLLARLLALPEARRASRGPRGMGAVGCAAQAGARCRSNGAATPGVARCAWAKRLVLAVPRLARIEEALAATRQAAVAEQTQRFASFAQQQDEQRRVLETRLAAIEGGRSSAILARVLTEAAEQVALPDAAALALLRTAPGPVLAPDAPLAVRGALTAAGLRLADGGAPAGALLVPPGRCHGPGCRAGAGGTGAGDRAAGRRSGTRCAARHGWAA
jgi:hypothetical protein